MPWCDLKAVLMMAASLPPSWHIHLSSGMSVRYFALAPCHKTGPVYANRGVNGIEGSTSTAMGASMAVDSTVFLISGDTCAAYDVGALATAGLRPNFKMAVLDNSGGEIFRHVATSASLPEREDCFAASSVVRLPLGHLARAYGFAFFEADSDEAFAREWPRFCAENSAPAIFRIASPAGTGAAEYGRIMATTSVSH